MIIEELKKAGVSEKVAIETADFIEKAQDKLNIPAEEITRHVISAINGGKDMTEEEIQELALQLDEDREAANE